MAKPAPKTPVRKPPSTFYGYRKWMADILKKAGAPVPMVEETAETEYEGAGIAGAIWDVWTNLEYEIKDIKRYTKKGSREPGAGSNEDEEIRNLLVGSVHDAVLDIVDAYQTSWNYEPGRKAAPVNGLSLAKRAESIASGDENPVEYEKSLAEKMDTSAVIQMIATALKREGAKVKILKSDPTYAELRFSAKNATNKKVLDYINGDLTDGELVPGVEFRKTGDAEWTVEDEDTRKEMIIGVDIDMEYADDAPEDVSVFVSIENSSYRRR